MCVDAVFAHVIMPPSTRGGISRRASFQYENRLQGKNLRLKPERLTADAAREAKLLVRVSLAGIALRTYPGK